MVHHGRATYNGDMDVKIDEKLDASGLTCPLPLLKAKQALNKLDSGLVLGRHVRENLTQNFALQFSPLITVPKSIGSSFG